MIQYGYYERRGPTPTVVPPAKQLTSINTLQISYNVSIGGNTEGFGVIFDMYLTTTPDGATPDMEIGNRSSPAVHLLKLGARPAARFEYGYG
jgi:hypothetical protein